jgi:hypothetical protein
MAFIMAFIIAFIIFTLQLHKLMIKFQIFKSFWINGNNKTYRKLNSKLCTYFALEKNYPLKKGKSCTYLSKWIFSELFFIKISISGWGFEGQNYL